MTSIFISTTLFALFASMLIGLGMVWKSISNNPDNCFCCTPLLFTLRSGGSTPPLFINDHPRFRSGAISSRTRACKRYF